MRFGAWRLHPATKKPGAISCPGANIKFQFPAYTDFMIRVNNNCRSERQSAAGANQRGSANRRYARLNPATMLGDR
jgi:hypothetical protein